MENETTRAGMILGLAVSSGIARGTAFVFQSGGQVAIPRRPLAAGEVPSELSKLQAAINEAEQGLLQLKKDVHLALGKHEADIFDVQILLLHDPGLHHEVTTRCSKERINVEAALTEAIEHRTQMFAKMEDAYFRERAVDLRDVGRRVLDILLKRQGDQAFGLPRGSIVVTDELWPSIAAQLDRKAVCGLIAEKGGQTSHGVILARSLGIPAVIHARDATRRIKANDLLVVDGIAGRVFINPPRAVRLEYDRLEADFKAHQNALKDLIDLPAVTLDGVRIKLCANIGKSADAVAADLFRADGVGLYRTEFVFLVEDHFPSAEEQYQIYKTVAARLKPGEVVIRVLDLGSDKLLPYFPLPAEANPSLGQRGTRLLLRYPEILQTQLRAILRLSASHPVSVLFPMIGGVEEIIAAKKAVANAKSHLRSAQQPFNPGIRIGAMIETPSAAITARRIAREVDFLSIGTNDLIQYLLITDRTSREMAHYYEPLHPAVIQTLKSVLDVAGAEHKEVSLCGEMAGNPAYTELLMGLGVRSLSAAPGEIMAIKKVIRSVSLERAEQVAKRVLGLGLVQEIKASIAPVPFVAPP
jgi:phosphotransferase system enzyme I (PtsI)